MKKEEWSFYIFGDSICFGQFVSSSLTWGQLHEALNARPRQTVSVMLQNMGSSDIFVGGVEEEI